MCVFSKDWRSAVNLLKECFEQDFWNQKVLGLAGSSDIQFDEFVEVLDLYASCLDVRSQYIRFSHHLTTFQACIPNNLDPQSFLRLRALDNVELPVFECLMLSLLQYSDVKVICGRMLGKMLNLSYLSILLTSI
jgi:hypothetical protein